MTFQQILSQLDPRWNVGRYEADCPACGGVLTIKPFNRSEGELSCPKGCSLAAITQALSSSVETEQNERVPHPAEQYRPQPPPETAKPKRKKRRVEPVTAADLMAMEFPEPRWAVPGYLCEGLNILAGSQKLGKSWLALGTAIAVASGGRALGKIEVEEGDVLYLALEDTLRRLKDRLGMVLKGEPAPPRLTLAIEWSRMDEGGIDRLRHWLLAKRETRLVIIDTLKKVRPPRGRNGSFYDEDYEAMSDLKEVADEFGVCMVVIHHVTKAAYEDVFNAVSGSMGLTGAADATLILERPRGSRQGTLHITGRDVEEKAGEDAMALEWDETTGSWTLQGSAREVGMSDERKQVLEVLELAGRPLGPKEISDMLNKNPATTRWLMRQMLDAGDVKSSGDGKYIPPNTPNTPNTSEGEERGNWWEEG